ncbi:MAG: hypothetical protein M1830_008385 [Pleopsidium flavum]|nr:MAG: hypothetical protein M1830_008385 [Pleopsidium flavum]
MDSPVSASFDKYDEPSELALSDNDDIGDNNDDMNNFNDINDDNDNDVMMASSSKVPYNPNSTRVHLTSKHYILQMTTPVKIKKTKTTKITKTSKGKGKAEQTKAGKRKAVEVSSGLELFGSEHSNPYDNLMHPTKKSKKGKPLKKPLSKSEKDAKKGWDTGYNQMLE